MKSKEALKFLEVVVDRMKDSHLSESTLKAIKTLRILIAEEKEENPAWTIASMHTRCNKAWKGLVEALVKEMEDPKWGSLLS